MGHEPRRLRYEVSVNVFVPSKGEMSQAVFPKDERIMRLWSPGIQPRFQPDRHTPLHAFTSGLKHVGARQLRQPLIADLLAAQMPTRKTLE